MISVIILAKNEEERIKACLESVKWADEIIIADNGSTDKTREIAKTYTDKIITFIDQDFATLRNRAIEQAKGDWVLYVDSDERVLTPLKDEILQLTRDPKNSAYAISRRNIIFGTEVNYGPFWPDWVIRLIKKSEIKGWVGKVHEYPEFNGNLGYTKNSLLHLTHRDIDHVMLKSLDWSNIDAKLRHDGNHPKMTGWRFIRVFFVELFYQGFIRKGFFGGTIGVIDSFLQTFSLFITYVRLWQLQQKKPLKKIYEDLDNELLKRNFDY